MFRRQILTPKYGSRTELINLSTTIHDVNERNHKMTQIFVKYILHLCIFRHLKLEIALAIPASNDEK